MKLFAEKFAMAKSRINNMPLEDKSIFYAVHSSDPTPLDSSTVPVLPVRPDVKVEYVQVRI